MAMVRRHRTQCHPASPPSLSLSRVVVFHSSVGVKPALVVGMGTLVRPVLMVWGPLNYVLHEILPDSMRGTGAGTGTSAGTGTPSSGKARSAYYSCRLGRLFISRPGDATLDGVRWIQQFEDRESQAEVPESYVSMNATVTGLPKCPRAIGKGCL